MNLSIDQLTRPLKIARRVQETPDAVSLVFEIPPELKKDFLYQPGQFVTLFLDIDGTPINRSYSLCSSPVVDSEFKITVKKVQGGRGSTFLCDQVKEGQVLRVTPPAGHFFKPSLEPTQYFLFAAGSGITPIYSILKSVLATGAGNTVTLLFCNRNEESVIYSSELKSVEQKFSGKLTIHQLLSQPSDQWTGNRGRCTTAWIDKTVNSNRKPGMHEEFYVCGPDGFMATVIQGLEHLKIDKSKIRQENFAIGLQPSKKADLNAEWTYIGDRSQATEGSGGRLTALVHGDLIECDVKEDQSILEALLEAGANPPYSCMDGACMACLGKIQEGLVFQRDPGILSDENIENREALTCQARVCSTTVRVSYDDI